MIMMTTRVIHRRTGGLDRRPVKTRTRTQIKHERMCPFVKVTYVCSFCMSFSQNIFVIYGQCVVSIPFTETRGLEMLWLDVVVIILLVAHSPILCKLGFMPLASWFAAFVHISCFLRGD
jgi:hypothetical protein